MVDRFRLEDVSKNPATFDVAKLEWMNGVYIRALESGELAATVLPLLEADLGRSLGEEELSTLAKVIPLVQERAKLLSEVAPQIHFLFSDVTTYDEASWAKVMEAEETPVALDAAIANLSALVEWDEASIEAALRAIVEENEFGARKAFQPVRVAVTGSAISPPLFESLSLLGRERTLERLSSVRDML
jgi:glutamyl-tRNA synthetase